MQQKFRNLKFTHIYLLTASLLQDLVALGVWLQKFYTAKVIKLDLRNCCFEECLSMCYGAFFYPLYIVFCVGGSK